MDKALKQRLVGASVLIALAVVVLPMLLSGQTDNQQDTLSIEVPPKPSELSFETRRFPVGDQPDDQPSVVPTQPQEPVVASTPDKPPVQVEQVKLAREQAPPTVESQEPGDSSTVQPEVSEQPGRYLVQVASFSTTNNANRLAGRLRADNLDVMMDTIEAAVGTLHRVRVGPYDELESANKAMDLIRSRTPDVNPRVIDLRPDESAPVTDPSDPLVRWVVQVGSFEAKENADHLVGRLRAAGFTAYSIVVRDGESTRYKVRVGPEIERQAAVRISAEIRTKLNLDGIVISVD